MNKNPEYDNLASIYDAWSAADPAAESTQGFYKDICCAEPGPVIELGIGNGRIALEIAQQGKSLTGIDTSSAMLASCRRKAELLNVANRILLIQEDVRSFTVLEPAALITFPFRSIGHLLTREDKVEMLRNVKRNLRPGGRLVFDHYVFDEVWARSRHGIPQLMCNIPGSDNTSTLVWDIYHYDFPRQRMNCFIVIEKLDESGTTLSRTYQPLSFSWVLPHEVHQLLQEADLEFEALYGDFEHGAFTSSSRQQVWVVKRPL